MKWMKPAESYTREGHRSDMHGSPICDAVLLISELIDMAAQNCAELNVPRDVAAEHRENSYEKPLPSAPDIQQPGEAGDVGNGTETGHTKPPVPDTPSSCKEESVAEGGSGSCRRPNVSEATAPNAGAEPSNPYSCT
jgi:S-methylmethionine-dependent homocysteine/selenocysteine methylase